MGRWARLFAFFAVVALVLAACGPAETGSSAPAHPNRPAIEDVLVVPTEGGLELILAASGEVGKTIPGGVASPDFSVLASTERGENVTLVQRLGPGGDILTRASVPGGVAARVVSPSGELVAVTEPQTRGSSPYFPSGRSRTRVAVVDAHGTVRNYNLRGNFDPEAFSTDDRQLFLLEYIPARAPTRYRVRRLVLPQRKVYPIGRLKTAAPTQMQGTGRTQVYSPNGSEVYTLYTQQLEAGHDHETFEGEHAFVHLLNLDYAWTHCIDLPESFGSGRATASAIAVNPDGSHLFVVDWSNGVVADAEPDELRVVRSESVDFGLPDDRTFAAATMTRLYVAGKSEVVVLDTDGLEVLDRWPMGAEITGLALSDDGERLYVSLPGEIDLVDASTGEKLRAVRSSEATGIAHVDSQG